MEREVCNVQHTGDLLWEQRNLGEGRESRVLSQSVVDGAEQISIKQKNSFAETRTTFESVQLSINEHEERKDKVTQTHSCYSFRLELPLEPKDLSSPCLGSPVCGDPIPTPNRVGTC